MEVMGLSAVNKELLALAMVEDAFAQAESKLLVTGNLVRKFYKANKSAYKQGSIDSETYTENLKRIFFKGNSDALGQIERGRSYAMREQFQNVKKQEELSKDDLEAKAVAALSEPAPVRVAITFSTFAAKIEKAKAEIRLEHVGEAFANLGQELVNGNITSEQAQPMVDVVMNAVKAEDVDKDVKKVIEHFALFNASKPGWKEVKFPENIEAHRQEKYKEHAMKAERQAQGGTRETLPAAALRLS